MRSPARVLVLSLLAVLALSLGFGPAAATAAEEGFKPIFDGKTLEGWDGDPKFWRVEDGCIVGETTKENPTNGNTFIVWRGGKPADFELRIEWKLMNHNTGVQIRSWEREKWRVNGYQADMDGNNTFTGIIYGEGFRGILAQRGTKTVIGPDGKPKAEQFADGKELAKSVKMQDWNEYHIVAKGNKISQSINGQLMCELTDEDKVARKDGIIALQLHAGPPMKVLFRNIRIKELPKAASAQATKRVVVLVDNSASMERPEAQRSPRLETVQRMAIQGDVAGVPVLLVSDAKPNKKKIVLIAGRPSHGYASHEHYAGCMLLAKCLNESGLPVEATVVKDGWPKDESVLDGAAAIVVFSDGGGGHPMMKSMDAVEKLMKKGVGLACLHYAVEIPKGPAGDQLKNWIGGYFETFWSVNPHWRGEFKEFPKHPVANGVKPFFMDDEWYYHMRFMDNMEGVTPILTATPPDGTRREGNDAHGANEHVRARKGMAEHVGWVRQRPDGGRGFGFTGGHWHWSWACDSFRTVVLNGIVWTAGLDVPAGGVPSKTPTFDELLANQDYPQPKNFDRAKIEKLIEEWKSWKP